MATEKEDLDQLMRSDGWLRFKQHVEKEWSDRFQQMVRQAVNNTEDTTALRQLQQIVVAKDAIQAAVEWPARRFAEIERAEPNRQAAAAELDDDQRPLSRRGPL